jgi:hypothetical protein
VEIVGQQAVVGGLQDVNIDAVNGSLYLTGNSTIQIAASTISIQNYVDISGALFARQVLGLSSINGSPFTGGGGWVGTATTNLNMNNYNITDTTGSNLIFLSNGISIKDSFNSEIKFDTYGEIAFNYVKRVLFNGYYGDVLNFGNGIYLTPAYNARFVVDCGNNSSPGYFEVGTTSGLIANEIYLTTPAPYGSGNGNISLNSISNVSIYASTNINLNGPVSLNCNVNANCNAISNVGAFSRYMISTNLPQPVIQYAYVSTTGAASGTVTITLPQRYTSVNSYIPFAVVQNDATTTFYVSTITRATFEIGWSGYLGFGDIIFSWNTLGT